MLNNRQLVVCVGNKTSRKCRLNNSLPQGSVLAPILFNLYTSDLLNIIFKKFIYADDIYVCKEKQLKNCETTLNKDLKTLETYFIQWRLQLNPDKTEFSFFTSTTNKLKITFCENSVKHNHNN